MRRQFPSTQMHSSAVFVYGCGPCTPVFVSVLLRVRRARRAFRMRRCMFIGAHCVEADFVYGQSVTVYACLRSFDIAARLVCVCIHGQSIRITVQGAQQVLLQCEAHTRRAALAARAQCAATGCCASQHSLFEAR